MASRRRTTIIFAACALPIFGACVFATWQARLWASLAGACAITAALLALIIWKIRNTPTDVSVHTPVGDSDDTLLHRLIFDQLPTPLVGLQNNTAKAVNRSARFLFDTDERIVPPPAELFLPHISHISLAGRQWRVDRVNANVRDSFASIVALIDVEAEGRAAEARASAELIQVLGHELLNGLAPIASLAESALAIVERHGALDPLLGDIMGTLARRAEGLQRFTEDYRALARLPEPELALVPVNDLLMDLEHMFGGRWGENVGLTVGRAADHRVSVDRNQVTQALWALLSNAAEAALAGEARPAVSLASRSTLVTVVFEVIDSGAGVTSADRNRIFRPFYTSKSGGSGIGLSLARQIARAHGGDVTLQPAMPTTFRFELPA
jgi:signal transduction histidine kinase